MECYICSGYEKNIKQSIEKNVSKIVETRLKNKVDQEVWAWGLTESTNPRYKNISLSEDDIIIVFDTEKKEDEETNLYIGKVVETFIAPDIAKQIWGDSKHSKIVVFKNKENYILSKREIKKIFNNGNKVLGPTKIKMQACKYEEVDEKIKLAEKESILEIKMQAQEFIENFDNIENIEVEFKSKKNSKNNAVGNKKDKKIIREARKDYPKELIGLCGEKIIHKIVKENDILHKRRVLEKDEDIRKIIFYNEDAVLNNEGKFIDKSGEYGHDIKVITNKREIRLEIKSSKDQLARFFLSYNELLDMKEQEKNSFLILVSKVLSDIPRVEIIRNFSDMYDIELLNIIMKQEIEVSKIPSRYLS